MRVRPGRLCAWDWLVGDDACGGGVRAHGQPLQRCVPLCACVGHFREGGKNVESRECRCTDAKQHHRDACVYVRVPVLVQVDGVCPAP